MNPSPLQNHLLRTLPAADYARLLPHLESLTLPLGLALYESGTPQAYVYFPTDSIVSLLYVLEDGSSAEIAVVGNEGLVGIALFMGGETTPSRAVVQSAGQAYRLRAAYLKEEFEASCPLQHLLLRYTQALLTQMAQTAVCNRHHTVDQQLCRWLLLSLDRLPSNELIMTIQSPNNSSANAAGDIQVQPGDHIPGIPRNNFKLRADWQATPKLSIGGTLVFTSSQYAQGDNNNEDQNGPVPGYTIFNLDARYNITEQLQVFGRINNLFNRKYQTAGVLGENFFTGPNFSYNLAGAQPSMFSSPGAPFGIWVGIRYDFARPAKAAHSEDVN